MWNVTVVCNRPRIHDLAQMLAKNLSDHTFMYISVCIYQGLSNWDKMVCMSVPIEPLLFILIGYHLIYLKQGQNMDHNAADLDATIISNQEQNIQKTYR